MYHYRLYDAEGNEADEAHYAFLVSPGEVVRTGDGRMLRVLDVVPTLEEDPKYVGMLKVQPA